MKKTTLTRGLWAVVLVAALSWMIAGCEQTSEVNSLQIVPSAVTLTKTNLTQQFTVMSSGPLGLPLVWSVSNPALGLIMESSGSNAVYVSTGVAGNNIVTARDQYGAEGYATVSQY